MDTCDHPAHVIRYPDRLLAESLLLIDPSAPSRPGAVPLWTLLPVEPALDTATAATVNLAGVERPRDDGQVR